jgi:hypothetical protein
VWPGPLHGGVGGWPGASEEARARLAAIYAWLTEGFDTPGLVEARGLLEELAGAEQA